MAITQHIAQAGRELMEFCYPSICRVCDQRALHPPLCETCLAKLEKLEQQPYCSLCALPVSVDGAPCPYCLGEGLFPFDRMARLCNYDEPADALIIAMKFHRAWSLGEFLAERLFSQPQVRGLLRQADVIIPVPLHPFRQMERGYNQAHVIARRLGRLAKLPVRLAAVRLVETEAQTALRSKSRRIENLRHAFGMIDAKTLVGRHVVLVDDVRTSAATLQSLGRCVRAAKPSGISAIVVAAADPRHSHFEEI